MSKFRYGRLAAVASSALLALMLLGPVTVSAATPGWQIADLDGTVGQVSDLPTAVFPGNDAGYSFVISNVGTSNISQLYLTDSVSTAPVYLDTSRGISMCTTSGSLFCAFGALNAGQSITVTVAYTTPTTGTAFSVVFQLNTTGSTFSDKNKTSHGDTYSVTGTTALNGSKNFGGAFTPDLSTIQNSQDLGPKNIQAGKVTPPAAHIPVTIEDGFADTAFTCTIAACTQRFGEWTSLNVDNGAPFASGIKLVITILGSKVPSYATVDTIGLIHVGASGPYTITTRCDATTTLDKVPGGAECITVTKVGNNFQIVAYLASNGQIRLF